MKKIMYVFLSCFVLACAGNNKIVANEDPLDIAKIFEVLENHRAVTIDQWSVSARTIVHSIETEKQFLNEVNEMKKVLPQLEWEIKKDSDKMIAVAETENEYFQEKISIVSQLNSDTATFVTHEWLGNKIDKDILKLLSVKLNDGNKRLIKENTTYFTCVKGQFNDTIDEVLTSRANNLLEMFHAKEIENLSENDFLSVTANSALFEQSSISDNYNLQIAMRIDGLGQKSSFVIGTPIITFEY